MSTLRICGLSLVLAVGLVVCAVGTEASAASALKIILTSDALGLGSNDINHGKNGTAVEADRPGKLVTDLSPNAGSVLTIQMDTKAGPGTPSNKLLVTITTQTHMDVETGVPAGADFQGGVIALTNHNTTKDETAKEGLGVRAFGIDFVPGSPTHGRRYSDPNFVGDNGHGFQMEGSKEVSGGVAQESWDMTTGTDWERFIDHQPEVPDNKPPHVDELVKFDFNDQELAIPAWGTTFELTKVTAGSGPLDLGVELAIRLIDGREVLRSYAALSDASDVFSLKDGYSDVVIVSLNGPSLGLLGTDLVDWVMIRAIDDVADDPKGTDEHFLIGGFSLAGGEPGPIPEPATMSLLALGAVAALRRKRK